MTSIAPSSSRPPRRATPSSNAMFIGALGLAALALWLVPGLNAAAIQAVTTPTRPNPVVQALSGPMLLDALKLLLAAAIGFVITAVQRATRKDQPITRAMAQSYVLLCIAGALTMTMIGDSLPRAFGVAGAASVVRFRTPIDDPRDGTALFLLMGLGMASGVGAFGIAIVGTVFLAACLVALSRPGGDAGARSMRVAVVADGPAFPVAYVSQVFSDYRITAEPLEISHGDQTIIRYRAVMAGHPSLDEVSQRLLEGGRNGIRSVSWDAPKRWN